MKFAASLIFPLGLLCAVPAAADTFSVWDENDYWGRWSDKYYTNHTRLAYTRDSGETPGAHYFFSIGQEMYTPANKSAAIPPANDRPYAGFLYASAGFAEHSQNLLRAVELQLGVVGPSALAYECQRDYHNFIDEPYPSGWDSQIKDQAGINLLSETRMRQMLAGTLGEGYASDLILRGFFSLGTVRTQLSGGAQIRYGINLPNDFGFTTMRQGTSVVLKPEVPASLYVFADFQADLNIYDVTLGGELLREHDSDVYAYPLSAEFSFGIAAVYDNWSVMFFQSFRSRDFSSADKTFFAFGGVRISYSF